MPDNSFATYSQNPNCFVVQNITTEPKVVMIFNYPINPGATRDLMAIPGVSEGDIRVSLLKGELKNKILTKNIIILCSDIDLLQFNAEQKAFLQSAGVVDGLTASGGDGYTAYLWRQEENLIGMRNGINRTFYTAQPFLNGVYITGDQFHISIMHNGKGLYEGLDYTIAESGGPGTGYDTINLVSFTPNTHSILKCTYAVKS